MTKLHLDWSDGRYSTRPLSDEEAATCEELGVVVASVQDHVYEAYLRHCEEDAVWQTLWQTICNEQSMRRRERELMPLEDAEREIARLKDELARAKRMETFYEERYAEQLTNQHREKWIEFTCVYPLPGCRIEALPAKWQKLAQEILEHY